MERVSKYTYRVTWSVEDGRYVGLCIEFPSLSWVAETQNDALSGIVKLVGDVCADMEANGEELPVPLSLIEYSGRFQVRIPPELHRRLSLEAAEAGISLNRLVSERLSRA
jgi:predicted HicB family RNase H-like nuclease